MVRGPSTVYGSHFAGLSAVWGRTPPNVSLGENFRFQRWCLFWVRLLRPRVGSGGSRPGCLAEKLLTNEQDCRARGEEQRGVSISQLEQKPPSKCGAIITP